MLANLLRTIAALCLLGAAGWIYLAVPGEPTVSYDPVLRRVVEVRPGWDVQRLGFALASAAGGLLWLAAGRALELMAEAVDILKQLRDRRGSDHAPHSGSG
jgi:hypothetical protein